MSTPPAAEIILDTVSDVLDSYRERLAGMTSWLSGEITVVDDHANAVKHRLHAATIASVDGRVVYEDTRYSSPRSR